MRVQRVMCKTPNSFVRLKRTYVSSEVCKETQVAVFLSNVHDKNPQLCPWDGSMVKTFATKPESLNSIPRSCMVEGQSQLPEGVLCPPPSCLDKHVSTHIHTSHMLRTFNMTRNVEVLAAKADWYPGPMWYEESANSFKWPSVFFVHIVGQTYIGRGIGMCHTLNK